MGRILGVEIGRIFVEIGRIFVETGRTSAEVERLSCREPVVLGLDLALSIVGLWFLKMKIVKNSILQLYIIFYFMISIYFTSFFRIEIRPLYRKKIKALLKF